MTWLELRYWTQLSISTLVGIPELSQQRKGRLLREGIYGVVRHPRYLSAGVGMIANALIVNHLGLYVLLIAVIPPWILDAGPGGAGTSWPLRRRLSGVSAECSTIHSTPAKDGG